MNEDGPGPANDIWCTTCDNGLDPLGKSRDGVVDEILGLSGGGSARCVAAVRCRTAVQVLPIGVMTEWAIIALILTSSRVWINRVGFPILLIVN